MKTCFVCKKGITNDETSTVMIAPLGCKWPGDTKWNLHNGVCAEKASEAFEGAFNVVITGAKDIYRLPNLEKSFLISMVPALKEYIELC